MSRRRGEFEHRTSIFEGAFRAWSHLGGLDPLDLEIKPASTLDPLTNPIENDTRTNKRESGNILNPDGSSRRQYPYEPLPRSGLVHPYVQAILSPWLGPDADNEAIQLGLTTLRTWWQHRRKGESGSAIAALGTEKMKGVVEGYTRHFFNLAHCLVVNDKEQPPRTLHSKMKELEKQRKKSKKRARDEPQVNALGALPGLPPIDENVAAALQADLTDSNLSPLERLHAAQRRQMADNDACFSATSTMINMAGKCVPGRIDLPRLVDAVNRQATQLAHRGGVMLTNNVNNNLDYELSGNSNSDNSSNSSIESADKGEVTTKNKDMQYGDPNTTPIVYVSSNGDIQIAMKVDGITCAHCVKIVETVLKGCNGNKSPIDGLLDAAADRVLCSVIVKVDHIMNAKRVAFESARNLAMVGYTAKPKEMSLLMTVDGKKSVMDVQTISRAFEIVARNDSANSKDVFAWDNTCTCPDNGILRDDCARHSQMDPRIFDAFDARAQKVLEFMAKEGMQYMRSEQSTLIPASKQPTNDLSSHFKNCFAMESGANLSYRVSDPQFAPEVTAPPTVVAVSLPPQSISLSPNPLREGGVQRRRSTLRNTPNLLYGNGMRSMSLASETTFGRAMSGLSALSIDWENLEDFDPEVDHSDHIINVNNFSILPSMRRPSVSDPSGPRRSSLRQSFLASTGSDNDGGHVTFKV